MEDDRSVGAHIEELVAEEHRLLDADPSEQGRHERLAIVRAELDRYWDLLRQRRGREEFGLDPDVVHERDRGTVEGYQQ